MNEVQFRGTDISIVSQPEGTRIVNKYWWISSELVEPRVYNWVSVQEEISTALTI
jgi:hypothetical protein